MGAFLFKFCVWLQDSYIGAGMRNSLYPFPTIETIHVFGVVVLVGSTSILDLRLLGVMLKNQPVSTVTKSTMPWIWAGLLDSSHQWIASYLPHKAEELYESPTFRLKMVLIILSGLNALLFLSISISGSGLVGHCS